MLDLDATQTIPMPTPLRPHPVRGAAHGRPPFYRGRRRDRDQIERRRDGWVALGVFTALMSLAVLAGIGLSTLGA